MVPAKSSKRNVDALPNARPSTPQERHSKSMESSRWASPKVQAPTHPNSSTRAQDVVSPTSARNINFSRPMSPQMISPPPSNRNSVQSPQPAASLGLTPEQYRRLEERREAARLQEDDWIERERARNEAQRLAKESAQAKAARPQSSSGPSTPQNATLIGQPLPKQRQAGVSPARNTRPASMPIGMTPPVPSKRITSAPSDQSRIETKERSSTQQRQPRMVSASAADAIPSPSDEQIRAFQTRAASLLARPLTDNYTAPSKPVTKSATTNNLTTSDQGKQHNRSVSSPVSASQQPKLNVGRGRAPSESPARSAHFSATPLLPVEKHNPPPRSVSPVKSAMKGSSPRGPSPAQIRDGSALSDAGSVLSDESSVPGSGRKKKSVRVSFEERPLLVGQAAEGTDSPINTILSPQYKTKASIDEQDFKMSPRPNLPSFGSVRGRDRMLGEDSLGETSRATPIVTTTPSLNDTVAALRDDDSNDGDEEPAANVVDGEAQLTAAPQIAILPATPNIEDGNKLTADSPSQTSAAQDVEGALSAEDAQSAAESHPKPIVEEESSVPVVPGVFSEPVLTTVAGDSDTDEGEEEAFSDTVEDQSELEDSGGYASLAAILESPATEAREADFGFRALDQTTEASKTEPIAKSPAATTLITSETKSVPVANASGEDWDSARAYWSSLSESQRRALETNHGPDAGPRGNVATTTSPRNNSRTQPNGSVRTSAQPAKSALKKPRGTPAAKETEATHFRSSMRHSGSMMSSMRGAPERSLSERNQQSKPSQPSQPSQPQASAEAIALAQATAQAMETERKATRAAAKEDAQRGRSSQNDKDFHYSMARSLRDSRNGAPARQISPDESTPSRKPMRGSVRGSIDSTAENKSGGFLGLGKSKQKQTKPKKAPSGGARRFASRFADSSDEDSDGGRAGRLGFRSRFADSDDSDDEAHVRPMKIQLAPVRGIPRKQGQEEGDSTELDDSDAGSPTKNEAALPRSSRDRPGTPPTSAVLSFGKSPHPAGIETSKHAPTSTESDARRPPTSPKAEHANGNPTEGKVLAAGTLRDARSAQDKDKRHSILGLGRKSKASEPQEQASLAESKWANTPSSAGSRPQTPSKGFAKTLRDNKGDKDKEKRGSVLRRFSIGSRDSSAPTTPTGGKAGKEDFPFPPPPIPDKYKSSASPEGQRPSTSDGLTPVKATVDEGVLRSTRPGLDRGDSAVTAPDPGQSTGSRRNRLQKDPIVSRKTGKAKKFQGLRRAFGLND